MRGEKSDEKRSESDGNNGSDKKGGIVGQFIRKILNKWIWFLFACYDDGDGVIWRWEERRVWGRWCGEEIGVGLGKSISVGDFIGKKHIKNVDIGFEFKIIRN